MALVLFLCTILQFLVSPLEIARREGHLHIAAYLEVWTPAHTAVAAARAAMHCQPFTVIFFDGDAAELPASRWMVPAPTAPPPGTVTDATAECTAAFADASTPVDLKALLIELHFAVVGDGATPAPDEFDLVLIDEDEVPLPAAPAALAGLGPAPEQLASGVGTVCSTLTAALFAQIAARHAEPAALLCWREVGGRGGHAEPASAESVESAGGTGSQGPA